jgi:hypothetical protein
MNRVATLMLGALLGVAVGARDALSADGDRNATAQPDLVKQANAPISSVLQVRFQDSYAPEFQGPNGQGNVFSIAVTMPLPEFRLLPFPQLSLLTLPVAVTLPGGLTGLGDLRLANIAVFEAGETRRTRIAEAGVQPAHHVGTLTIRAGAGDWPPRGARRDEGWRSRTAWRDGAVTSARHVLAKRWAEIAAREPRGPAECGRSHAPRASLALLVHALAGVGAGRPLINPRGVKISSKTAPSHTGRRAASHMLSPRPSSMPRWWSCSAETWTRWPVSPRARRRCAPTARLPILAQ